ncbi:MAG: SDR family NAD(P)-dependent oxidoreductase [Candidatus Dormiibacterota bacterium]
MIEVRGQVAFLTGAAEGLGHEVARELAAAGMRLALFDVQADKLNALSRELTDAGADVFPIVVDLAEAGPTQDAVERALGHYGTPRALIHNAAVLREREFSDITFPGVAP